MIKTDLRLIGLRAATTCNRNRAEDIHTSVSSLIDAMVDQNGLNPESIVSVTFSVTADLNACFPASIARQRPGWDGVALLDCQQMKVQGDLERCIRLLAHVWLPSKQKPIHTYLEEAKHLRPDRSIHT